MSRKKFIPKNLKTESKTALFQDDLLYWRGSDSAQWDIFLDILLILSVFFPKNSEGNYADYNGFRGGPQSDIPHKAAKNTEALFFSVISVPLCGTIKKI